MPLSSQGQLLEQIKNTYYAVLGAFEDYVGMSQERLQILEALSAAPDSSQVMLQQYLGLDRASINRYVKQLEGHGLVLRRTDPDDNRFSQVSITEEGRRRLVDLLRKRDALEELVMKGIEDEDFAVLQKCLARIQRNVQERSLADDIPF